MTSVRHVRAVSVPAGLLEVVNGACSRRLFLLVSGSLEVTVPHMRATLHEGDVLFVDVPERLAAAAELTAAMGCSYLEVQVGAGWLPVGIVPPALDEEPRSDPSALRVVRMASDGERAHLTPFDALFTEWPARPQDVSALTFICLSPSMTSDWHTEEGVTLLVVLAGGFEVEVGGNGGRRTLRPGDTCLVEDFEGQGHKSATHGETRFAALRLPRDHHWSGDANTGRTHP
ncbi:hypothetical protein JCM18899A_22540 [Nocardioides sp. AN3]